MSAGIEQRIERFRRDFQKLEAEISKTIVGQREVIRQLLIALFAEGHVLLEGLPGLGKTLLVKSVASALRLNYRRIQGTSDLMPADVTGTMVLADGSAGGAVRFRFEPGPVFTHLLLVDEINRAGPRTQSAMLEAMQERAVTVGGETRLLEAPFMVLATQNPIETEGTYLLPAAELDRFFFKIRVSSSEVPELVEILDRTTGGPAAGPDPVLDREGVLDALRLVREVPAAAAVCRYAARLVTAAHPDRPGTAPVAKYIRYGPSPRGAQALILGGKARALVEGRLYVGMDDVRALALPALRHRIVPSFEALAEGWSPDRIAERLLEEVPLDEPRVERLLKGMAEG
jgi:MoxR-like ATPase